MPQDHPENTFSSTLGAFKTALHHDVERSIESFREGVNGKHYLGVGIKALGCGLGCVVGAQGVYQIVKGVQEEVPNPEAVDEPQMNWSRVFVGTLSAFLGAMTLYIAAQKNVHLGRAGAL